MTFVPRALEWARAVLFGTRKPGRHSRARAVHAHADRPAQAPAAYAVQPSPEVWGGLLALARLHRAGRTPAPLDVQHDQGETGALVRAYVLTPEERRHVLSARQLTEVRR